MHDKDRLILSLFAALAYARDAGSFSDSDRLFIDGELFGASTRMQALGIARSDLGSQDMSKEEREAYMRRKLHELEGGIE